MVGGGGQGGKGRLVGFGLVGFFFFYHSPPSDHEDTHFHHKTSHTFLLTNFGEKGNMNLELSQMCKFWIKMYTCLGGEVCFILVHKASRR